jgi:hypothetical protein
MKKRTKLVTVGIVITVLGAYLYLFFAIRQSQRLQVAGLESWISQQVPRLTEFEPGEDTPMLEPERRDDRSVTYPSGEEGLIRLSGEQWVFFTAYSSHGSGNLILALDSEGHLYASNGHVCSHLVLSWRDRPAPEEPTLADFRASRVSLGGRTKGAETWRLVDEWRNEERRKH